MTEPAPRREWFELRDRTDRLWARTTVRADAEHRLAALREGQPHLAPFHLIPFREHRKGDVCIPIEHLEEGMARAWLVIMPWARGWPAWNPSSREWYQTILRVALKVMQPTRQGGI